LKTLCFTVIQGFFFAEKQLCFL
jgi:hypothetical protein